MNRDEFLSQARIDAIKPAARLGVDPLLLIAQAALESGWGEHTAHADDGGTESYAIFGVKATASWHGRTASGRTVEYNGKGGIRHERGRFRAYDTLADAFLDYADFIRGNHRYGKALRVAHLPMMYLAELQRAGYATDPYYASRVIEIYRNLVD